MRCEHGQVVPVDRVAVDREAPPRSISPSVRRSRTVRSPRAAAASRSSPSSRWTPSARYTTPRLTSRPSAVGRPPRSRTLNTSSKRMPRSSRRRRVGTVGHPANLPAGPRLRCQGVGPVRHRSPTGDVGDAGRSVMAGRSLVERRPTAGGQAPPMSIRGKAVIVGAYEHPRREIPDRTIAQIHREVAVGALADAGLTLADVDAYFCDSMAPGSGPSPWPSTSGWRPATSTPPRPAAAPTSPTSGTPPRPSRPASAGWR